MYMSFVCSLFAGPGSHFCENIGRDHQSNCIYFLLDLAAGMYCQKCYDPDCAHYRLALDELV